MTEKVKSIHELEQPPEHMRSLAFGVSAPNMACAVEGCGNRGRPQICPHDGRYHRHGMVHYWCGSTKDLFAYRKGWHFLCNEHFAIVKAHLENPTK